MLQAIRDKAQGWIAWVIVILISVPFALWGIQEYLGVGGDPVVVSVEGQDISERDLDRRTRDFRDRMRQQLGNNYRADLFDDATLKEQVLQAMIDERVQIETARDWNLRAGDAHVAAYIRSRREFQRDGKFNGAAYEAGVRNQGMTRAGFEDAVRQDLVMDQLRAATRASAFVTEYALAESVRLQSQERDINYLRIPAEQFKANLQVTDQQARAHYESNQPAYRVAERVKLDYILLNADSVAHLVEVDEERLQEYFSEHRAEFVAAQQRKMRHILIAAPNSADEATDKAAKEKAAALLGQLKTGADFAELAKANSADPGSAAKGGDLDWVNRGDMVKPFEDAGYALEKGGTSELVRTRFGYHIIRVDDIRGGTEAKYAKVKDKVEASFRKTAAANLYYEYAERLADSAYENPDSLEPVAESLGLKVEKTDWINRQSGLSGALASPKVINAAFSEDVLTAGHNSELLEVGTEQAIVLRDAEHEEETVKPLDSIRDQVNADALAELASEAAAKTGKEVLAALQQGSSSLSSEAQQKSWKLEQAGMVARDNLTLPAEILKAAFALTPAADDKSVYGGVVSAEGDYFLLQVKSVKDGDLASLDETRKTSLREQLLGRIARSDSDQMSKLLRDRSKIDRVVKEED